jgi:dienelactone hydrolase
LERQAVAGAKRQIALADLMTVRDIGGMADVEAPFSVSPDGRKVVVAFREADVERNDYCQAFVIVDIAAGKIDKTVPVGGGIRLTRYDAPNLPDYGAGGIAPIVPRWSPDGRWLAYLERRDGIWQLMRVSATGGAPEQLTTTAVDIRDFHWGRDVGEIRYSARPGDSEAQKNLAEEGRRGFRFDARWVPGWRNMPFPALTPTRHFTLEIPTATVREEEERAVDPSGEDIAAAVDNAGSAARLRFQTPGVINGPKQIIVKRSTGEQLICRDAVCAKARRLWWRDTDTLIIARETGWGGSMTELVSWTLHTNKKRSLAVMEDRLDGCQPSKLGLVCAIENAKMPRRLELVDYRSGRRTLLFDPNPEWRNLDLGRVRRMHWRNNIGQECFGDLVLPPGTKNISALPLIVIGYQSRGFLRGGTGDLFPVFPLAAKGFAILVYHRPEFFGYLQPAHSQAEADRRGIEGWADKKSVTSSILTGISMLVDGGIVDPARIGLTGFSDGVDKAGYLLLHHNIFRAVSMAACCGAEPMTVNTAIGPYFSDIAIASGYPAYVDRDGERIHQISLAANAQRIDTPILIQSGDREFWNALEIEAAFRQSGKPISLYVYPDEYHVLWQPAHRWAAYSRNEAWFDYYLLKNGKGPMPDWIRPTSLPQ